MTFQIRLAVIVATAVMAGAVHHRYLADQLAQRQFVAAAHPIKVGQALKSRDLQAIWLGGDLGALAKVLLPWDEQALVLGKPVLRDFNVGELLVRRDVEPKVNAPYLGQANEYVFVVDMPSSLGLKNAFQIGSAVGFLVETPGAAERGTDIRECGPFVLRQFGSISRSVDTRILERTPTTSVTLSCPEASGGQRPARAQQLLNALSGTNGARIVGLYRPHPRPPAGLSR